jgi:hypothetical protein
MTDMFQDSLDAVYSALGVDATLAIGTESYTIRVVDKTAGQVLNVGKAEMPDIKPMCAVKIVDLATLLIIDYSNLIAGNITFNGETWEIINYQPKPTPYGGGELYLELRQ